MESGYVLHRRRYRESSLIVEFLTREQGRVAAVARGALRRKSALAGVLQPLVPLKIDCRGRGELLTLTHAEVSGSAARITGERLYCVFYVNELLMRLTTVHDPQPALYEVYEASLRALANASSVEPTLRAFERDFLEIIGLGMNLERTVDSGTAIEATSEYDYVADHGPMMPSTHGLGHRIHGTTLLALAGTRDWQESTTHEAKHLMRYVLNHHLDGRPLAARELFSASRARKS